MGCLSMGDIPCEMHAYEKHSYERRGYEIAYGRYTPMRGTSMRWRIDTHLRERYAYEMAPYEISEIGKVPNQDVQ